MFGHIYKFCKKSILKLFSIPLLNKFLGFFLFQQMTNSMPMLINALEAMAIINLGSKLLENNFLRNIRLFVKQNLLAIIKLAPIISVFSYVFCHDVLLPSDMISIFADTFDLSLFSDEVIGIPKLFSALIFAPLISLVGYKLYPWIDSAQECKLDLKIDDLDLFNNEIELDLNKVHTYFKRTCEVNNVNQIKLYITPSPIANAYAIGLFNNYSSVCISIGLLNEIIKHNQDNPKKAYRQINAILSHEIGHILNRHLLKSLIYSMIWTPFMHLSSFKIGEDKDIEDFVDGVLCQKQEYEADDHAKKMGHQKDLAKALKIINGKLTSEQLNSDEPLTCLYNKFKLALLEGNQFYSMITEWNATHPTTYNRIANLKSGRKTSDNKNNAKNPLSFLVSDTPYQDNPFDEDYVPRKNKK